MNLQPELKLTVPTDAIPDLPENLYPVVARCDYQTEEGETLTAVGTGGDRPHLYILQLIDDRWVELYVRKLDEPVSRIEWLGSEHVFVSAGYGRNVRYRHGTWQMS